MPVFSYRAINEDGKEVRGSIDSPDLEAARKAVEDLHLEVVDVSEASRSRGNPSSAKTSSGEAPSATFAFEGTDAAGTVRRGTIQAPTKRQAFDKLRNDQKLTLTMLAPMGTLPKYNDPDLESWQGGAPKVQIPVQPVSTTVPLTAAPKPQTPAVTPEAPKPKPVLQFTAPVAPTPKKEPTPVKKDASSAAASSAYHSIGSTLRLYAGWLLAWYGLFVAIGYYATVRALPWDIPFVQAFYVSPLIFSFTVAIYLFLCLSEIHRALRGRLILGILLGAGGVSLFLAVRTSL